MQSLLEHLPPLLDSQDRAGELEVIYIDDKEELLGRIPEARAPLRDGKKAQRFNLSFTMALPEPARVRVAVQRQDEGHHWRTVLPNP